MKTTKTIYICDRCGCEINEARADGWCTVADSEYSFIGVKVMFSNCGVGSKYDLCKKCTIEIAKQFIELAEKEQ